ncbi:sigma E protease regulator RseP [Alteromonas sp. a30]|uniref:sigma E protease regulator RseP n=1 Tax=Alteromonas sp. a30 TaxID=2730917 RepID=UPI00228311DC|nr:sigma E protease regulator RseP [Alteromonas sp. a30]MCY7294318.1 sigma E protease regulator RseP [Alteromonas sp. a30]
MFGFVWSFVFFVIAIGVLIAVHEWGHFYVARRFGIKVLRFNIGFGKPLWKTVDKQGTEYALSAIPLGGYVRMLDSRVDDVSEDEKEVEFHGRPVPQKMAVFAAGPLVNLIFAVFAMFLVYLIGVESVKPVIGHVTANSIAQRANLPVGSEIVAIDGNQTRDWEAVNFELVSHIGDEKMVIDVQHEGMLSTSQVVLDIRQWQFDPDKTSPLMSLGIEPFRPAVTTEVGLVAESSPASRAGLQVNDKIVQLDGTPIGKWEQIVEYISARPSKTIGIMVEREGKTVPIMAAVGVHPDRQGQGYLGIVPKSEAWPEKYRFNQQYGVIGAIEQAILKTWRLITLSFEMIGKLLTGDVSVKNLSGPISIAQGAGASAGFGVVYFLSFLALISVNLGIINLLPLPVLDGGHLLYYFIELLRGKPVPEHIQEIGFRIGGAIIMLLMAVAIFNDIARL